MSAASPNCRENAFFTINAVHGHSAWVAAAMIFDYWAMVQD